MDLLPISTAQQKLIANALRTRILHITERRSLTAKQVSEELGETPGNVHYHLQRLLAGGLVDVVETRAVRGIVEKYYRAKSTHFLIVGEEGRRGPFRQMTSCMSLTDAQADQLILDLSDVLHRWEQAMARPVEPGATARHLEFTISAAEPD